MFFSIHKQFIYIIVLKTVAVPKRYKWRVPKFPFKEASSSAQTREFQHKAYHESIQFKVLAGNKPEGIFKCFQLNKAWVKTFDREDLNSPVVLSEAGFSLLTPRKLAQMNLYHSSHTGNGFISSSGHERPLPALLKEGWQPDISKDFLQSVSKTVLRHLRHRRLPAVFLYL